MGKNMRQRVKKDTAIKMVYTHGKKRNAIANAVVQEGKGTITVNRIPIQTDTVTFTRNNWAKPQAVMHLQAANAQRAADVLRRNHVRMPQCNSPLCNAPHSSVSDCSSLQRV